MAGDEHAIIYSIPLTLYRVKDAMKRNRQERSDAQIFTALRQYVDCLVRMISKQMSI